MVELNSEQKKAVEHTEGPLLILAGAGSGKTSTMTNRIAHLLDTGVSPYNILAVTFTNKAAAEMRERVEALAGGRVPMWIMTFHAACLRILRSGADILGYGKDFVVYDTEDIKSCIRRVMKELGIDTKNFPVKGVMSVISGCKEAEMTPDDYLDSFSGDPRKETMYEIYRGYDRILRRNNAMDFDDLLLNTVRLFEADERTLAYYQNRFRYIMVDEYQDTNRIQYKFVRYLADAHRNICVVGDDDQCIYQWRGADIRNILDFEKDFPDAEVIKLEQNYRSTANILAAAHSVISNNGQRKKKQLWTNAGEGSKIVYRRADSERDEAHYVAQEISRLHFLGRAYRDMAVLYRVNAQSRVFEEAFSKRGIPYRVVGSLRYYERKEIKDMLAYMRLVQEPSDDVSLLRVINEPKRGIGSTTVSKLTALAAAYDTDIFSCLKDDSVLGGISAKTRNGIRGFTECVEKYHGEQENLRVSDIYDGLLRDTGYLKSLEDEDTVEADSRIENLLEFKTVIEDYDNGSIDTMNAMQAPDDPYQYAGPEGYGTDGGSPGAEDRSLTGFLEKISLLSDIDDHDTEADAVTIMTMHSAKGLEFPVVFMPGMEDGLFPGWRSVNEPEKLEEERRLCYVGMTRAKEKLYLTGAEYRTMYGSGSFTRESRFLRELDPKLLTGDAVFEKKSDVRFGEHKGFDGYAEPSPADPFDRLRKAKKEVREKKHAEALAPGDTVRHAKFGDGVVISADGNIVEVMFDKAGRKKLMSDIAPMEKTD